MPTRCLALSDEAAHHPTITGAKAAGLARAHRAGLPVLPGVVVPVVEAEPVVDAVTSALEEHGNEGRARLAAIRIQPDDELIAELQELTDQFATPLIVRSSSPLEADGTWSGAFSSFHGVRRDELATAVRGCWGAAFSVGVLDRARQTRTPPDRLGLAVLIQPELDPDVGGTARLRPDGSVRITSTEGPLLPLMAGDVEGRMTVVGPDDEVTPERDEVAIEVARLSRRVGELLDHQLIEWAAVDGHVYLLQSIRSAHVVTSVASTDELDPVLGSEVALRIAALTQRFPGRLGNELVLPWAVGAASVALPRPAETDEDPVAALATARSLASELTNIVWGGSPRSAAAEAEKVLRQLRGDAPQSALEVLAALTPPNPEVVAQLLGRLETVRRRLRTAGVLDSDAAFWRLSADDLERALHGTPPPQESRFGVDRWEPFVHGVVRATGESFDGTPAAPGAGAGRAHLVVEPITEASPEGRYVLVAAQPVPALSPLLWNAAGLVTRAGSTAAHLIEFAHSIGVPTVVGCQLPSFDPSYEPPLVAVDGDAGRVAVAWVEGM